MSDQDKDAPTGPEKADPVAWVNQLRVAIEEVVQSEVDLATSDQAFTVDATTEARRDVARDRSALEVLLAAAPTPPAGDAGAEPAGEGAAGDIIQRASARIAELDARQGALHARAWVAAEYRVAGSPHEWTDEDALAMARFILAGPAPAGDATSPAGGDNLAELSARATPGPWFVSGVRRRVEEESCVHINAPSCASLLILPTAAGEQALDALADAKFVVALERAYREGRAFTPSSIAARDVLYERRRQVEAEGWTPEHDDAHATGELARAAACYAKLAGDPDSYSTPESCPVEWPWSVLDWKWTDRRRDLVKAGALLLAEIERLDRAEHAQRGDRP